MKWSIGRVIKIYKGMDEIVRAADVKIAAGVFKRAVRYLAPLQQATDNFVSHRSTQSDEMPKK